MRRPWRREPARPVAAADETGLAEAKAAERRTLAELQEARRRSHEVHAVVARLRELRGENHFAERVTRAIRDGYGPDGE